MGGAAPADARAARFGDFVASLVAELEPLERRHNHAYWLAQVTGEPGHEQESARLDTEMRLIFARPEAYAGLERLAADGPLADPLLERQLQLLRRAHRARQLAPEAIEAQVRLEKRLESRFNNFRATLDGREVTDNAIAEVLRASDDRAERRRAWEAGKQVGAEVEADLLALVRLRNQGARALGFGDYYAMMLELDELDERELFALLADLERGTDAPWAEYRRGLEARAARRFGGGDGGLAPWDCADPFFQEAPDAGTDVDGFYAGRDLVALGRDFYAALGFDLGPVLARSDLEERPGKCQHAFCLSVDRGADVRVLANVRPNERWMGTLLHEFGHAVYDLHVDPALPWLLRQHAHLLATEASAMLFGRLSRNPAWLRAWAGADDVALARRAGPLARALGEQLLVQTRWQLVMIHMERALYRDPEQDLRSRWWELVGRLQGLRRPEGRDAPDWAAKIHFSIAPVYYQNYLLGEMLASQLQDAIQRGPLGDGPAARERFVTSPRVGEFLRDLFYAPGRRWDWRALTTRATGRPLEPRPFVAEIAGAARA